MQDEELLGPSIDIASKTTQNRYIPRASEWTFPERLGVSVVLEVLRFLPVSINTRTCPALTPSHSE